MRASVIFLCLQGLISVLGMSILHSSEENYFEDNSVGATSSNYLGNPRAKVQVSTNMVRDEINEQDYSHNFYPDVTINGTETHGLWWNLYHEFKAVVSRLDKAIQPVVGNITDTILPYVDKFENASAAYANEFLDATQPLVDQFENDAITYVDEVLNATAPYVEEFENTALTYVDVVLNASTPYVDQFENTAMHYVDEALNVTAPYVKEFENAALTYVDVVLNATTPYVDQFENTAMSYVDEAVNATTQYVELFENSTLTYADEFVNSTAFYFNEFENITMDFFEIGVDDVELIAENASEFLSNSTEAAENWFYSYWNPVAEFFRGPEVKFMEAFYVVSMEVIVFIALVLTYKVLAIITTGKEAFRAVHEDLLRSSNSAVAESAC